MSVSAKPAPWEYHENALGRAWEWETDHFLSRIQSDDQGTNYSWSIADKSKGRMVTIGSGMERTYNQAEENVRELVGKSYAIRHGYRAYAGNLAMTFRIYTGERFDFSDLEAHKVVIIIQGSDGNQQELEGTLSVVHHKVQIETEGKQTYSIEPSYIVSAYRKNGQYAGPATNQVEKKPRRVRDWLLGV